MVLCDPTFYKSVKYHAEIRTLVAHGVLPQSTLFNAAVRANLPAFSAFELDGLVFVNVIGYEDYLPAGGAVMVPVFADNIVASDHTPLEVVSGPASRNAKIAAAGTRAEFFQYSFDDRLGNKTVMSEFGVLPLIYDLSMITKLTTSTGE